MPTEASHYLRLMDCGTLRTGQSFRKAPIEDPESQHYIIQTKDLLPSGKISQKLTPVSTLSETPKPNVESGDILILARGVRFNAGVACQLPGKSTALNMFYTFKPRTSDLLPEFIVAYINNPSAQERLKSWATGATIPHLKADDLGSFRIPVPSLQQQHAYVALAEAAQQEKELLEKLARLRNQQLRAAIGFNNLK